jgi:hypothetical protein
MYPMSSTRTVPAANVWRRATVGSCCLPYVITRTVGR